jgi:NitT/TauT family transport system substrate-binding protein
MTVRITASRHTAFYAPLLATMAAGFLDKHGLEFTYGVLAPGETAAGMIREGKTDVMQSAPSTNWAKMERGETDFPLNFALINQRDGFFLVGRKPRTSPFDWKELEGRALLADHGSQPLTMLRYAVQFNGVDWQKIETINAGSVEEMTAAFKNGTGDFLHVQAPTPQVLEEQGAGWTAVSVGASMPPNAFSSLCASREFIAGSVFPRFVAAFAEAKAWVQHTSAEEIGAKLTGHFPEVSQAALTSAIAGYKRIGAWLGGAGISPDLYEQSLNVFESTGRITKRHSYDEVCFALNN